MNFVLVFPKLEYRSPILFLEYKPSAKKPHGRIKAHTRKRQMIFQKNLNIKVTDFDIYICHGCNDEFKSNRKKKFCKPECRPTFGEKVYALHKTIVKYNDVQSTGSHFYSYDPECYGVAKVMPEYIADRPYIWEDTYEIDTIIEQELPSPRYSNGEYHVNRRHKPIFGYYYNRIKRKKEDKLLKGLRDLFSKISFY